MLRLASINVNGIRAALRKGMEDWIADAACDVVTLQEVRAPDDIARDIVSHHPFHVAHSEAEAKGRAGVAIWSMTEPAAVRQHLGAAEFERSGRWIEADLRLPGGDLLTVVSAYVHSGEAGTPKQEEKYRFLGLAVERLASLAASSDHVVLTGDLNVGHTERDIKNWKGNRRKAGFLPEERAYLDRLIDDVGYVDVHRALSGDVDGPYTWWSMRGKAFDTDTGWRIDYQLATPGLAAAASSVRVDRAPSWAERWSDHAPLVVDYDV